MNINIKLIKKELEKAGYSVSYRTFKGYDAHQKAYDSESKADINLSTLIWTEMNNRENILKIQLWINGYPLTIKDNQKIAEILDKLNIPYIHGRNEYEGFHLVGIYENEKYGVKL